MLLACHQQEHHHQLGWHWLAYQGLCLQSTKRVQQEQQQQQGQQWHLKQYLLQMVVEQQGTHYLP
jgi:hypothetical protein